MPEPLSRSTKEAYFGIVIGVIAVVFPITWWIKGVLMAVVAGIALDVVYRHPKTAHVCPLIRAFLGVLAISIVGGISYKPVYDQYLEEHKPCVPVAHSNDNIPLWWGATRDHRPGFQEVDVNGGLYQSCKSKYKVVAMCFRWNGVGDVLDAEGLQKSDAITIRSERISILIQTDSKFYESVMRDSGCTDYAVILVPNEVNTTMFSTLRQAYALGAQKVWYGSGSPCSPPSN